MRKLHDTSIAIILVGVVAALALSSAALAQSGQQVTTAQASSQPSPSPQPMAAPRNVLANLVDTVDINSSVLDQAAVEPMLLNRLIRGGPLTAPVGAVPAALPSPQPSPQVQAPQIDAVYLLDQLNASEQQQARELLNNSQFLVRNARLAQGVARRNPELRSFFQRNNIPLDRLWALDVVGQPTTAYVWASSPTGAPSVSVPRPVVPAAPVAGAAATPSPTATLTATPASTVTPTPAATLTPSPAATATPEATATPAATATPEPTATPETTGAAQPEAAATPGSEATPTP